MLKSLTEVLLVLFVLLAAGCGPLSKPAVDLPVMEPSDILGSGDSAKATRLLALGKYYRYEDITYDSAFYYFETALTSAVGIEQINNILFHMAELSLIRRDHFSGLSYLSRMQDFTNIPAAIQARSLEARLLRKLKRYEESDAVIYKALTKWGTPIQQVPLRQELAFNAIVRGDDILFTQVIGELQTVGATIIHRLIGNNAFTRSNYALAARSYVQWLDLLLAQESPDIAFIKECFFILTESFKQLGNHKKAYEYAYQSIVYDTRFVNEPFSWDVLHRDEVLRESYNFFNYKEFAEVVYDMNTNPVNKTALTRVLSLLKLLDKVAVVQLTVTDDDAIQEFKVIASDIYQLAIEVCATLYAETSDDQWLRDMWYFIERSKSFFLFRDIVADSEWFQHVPMVVKQREGALKSEIIGLKKRLTDTKGDLESLQRLIAAQQAHHEHIRTEYPSYYQARLDQQIQSLDQVQVLVDSTDNGIVQYYRSNNKLISLLLRPKRPVLYTQVPVDEAWFQQANKFLIAVNNTDYHHVESTFETYQRAASYLFGRLLPAKEHLPERLMIIPDGELHYLPFGALLTDTTTRDKVDYRSLPYMERQIILSYAYSMKTYLGRNRPSIDRCFVGFSYNDEGLSSGPLKSLPGSFEEVRHATASLSNTCSEHFAGREATKEQFMNQLSQPIGVLHLATHATSSQVKAHENKIHFRSNGSRDSAEFLYGYELLSHPLDVELVVLSACESGTGVELQGEGVLSLGRSFIQAGAQAVISSLWKQVDFSASEIQTHFYEELNQGASAGTGLHRAKASYLRTANKINAHPGYWAGIVYYGL